MQQERGRTPKITRRRSSFFSPSPTPPPPAEREQRAYVEDKRHLSMIRQLQWADWITMLNCYCGFNSIISSARYITHGYQSEKYTYRAMFFTFAGFFFDVFDGRVARWQGKSSLMGKELDSLADLVSFGVAPATIAFTLGSQSTSDSSILSFFVSCGSLRLARFNVTAAISSKGQAKVQYFEGSPIPSSSGLVILMAGLVYTGKVQDKLPFGYVFADKVYASHPFSLIFFAHGCAYVSKTVKIPKI